MTLSTTWLALSISWTMGNTVRPLIAGDPELIAVPLKQTATELAVAHLAWRHKVVRRRNGSRP